MNKKILIYGGISAGSLLIGGVGGWFAHDIWTKKKENDAKKAAEQAEIAKFEAEAVVDERLDPKKTDAEYAEKQHDRPEDILDTVQYFKFAKEYIDRGPEAALKPEKTEEKETDISDIPYSITADQWSYDAEFDKETVIYYAKDDTFARVNDDIIDDPDYLLGPMSNDFFRIKEGEFNQSYYIRNEHLGRDYEVVRKPGSYKEIVLGESEDDSDPY